MGDVMIRLRNVISVCAGLLIFAAACSGSPSGTSASPAQPSTNATPSPSSPASTSSPSPSATVRPAEFGAKVDNPWFPLAPGTTLVYKGVKDGETSIDRVVVTHETRVIGGATCIAVHDNL